MKDRITWVPSLLTGELIPKKTSVWDLDDAVSYTHLTLPTNREV